MIRVGWVREMLEAVVGLVLIVVASFLLPTAWVSPQFLFCLFFLVVAAIALRYRTGVAYTTGAAAGSAYLILCWQHPVLSASFNVHMVSIAAFLLFLSGIVVSDITSTQRERLIKAEKHYAEADGDLQLLTQRYQKALAVNTELERQIAGQTASITSISEKLTNLWVMHGNERYGAILEAITHASDVQSTALYMHFQGQMRLCASSTTSGVKHSLILDTHDPLIKQVYETGQVRTVRDMLTDGTASSVALMAGPLLDNEGQIIGIVVIDNMPLLKFTPHVVRLFESILRMASVTLQLPQLAPMAVQGESLEQQEEDTQVSIPALSKFRVRHESQVALS